MSKFIARWQIAAALAPVSDDVKFSKFMDCLPKSGAHEVSFTALKLMVAQWTGFPLADLLKSAGKGRRSEVLLNQSTRMNILQMRRK
jgi:hypothetical protein